MTKEQKRRYPGLTPFSFNQKDVFFGRDGDTKRLSRLIFVKRKVLLYSKSGYGKTSLINAGVKPELEKEKNKEFKFIPIRFRAYTENNTSTPRETLQKALLLIPELKKIIEKKAPTTILDYESNEYSDTLWSIFKKNQLIDRKAKEEDNAKEEDVDNKKDKIYLLIFDQFEELFTYPKELIDEFNNEFADIINTDSLPTYFKQTEKYIFKGNKDLNKTEIKLLYNSINVKALFSIRSDKLSELNLLTGRIPDIQKVHYELKPLSEEDAKKAIIGPTEKEGADYEYNFSFTNKKEGETEDAVQEILDTLKEGKGAEVELPQLQLVLQKIEDTIVPQIPIDRETKKRIVKKSNLPEFSNLFHEFYIEAIAKIETGEQKKARQFIEDELIKNGRRITVDSHVSEDYISENTLKDLVDLYLIREENTTLGSSYELCHDVLIEPIDKIAEKRRYEDKRNKIILKTIIIVGIVGVIMGVLAFWALDRTRLVESNRTLKDDRDTLIVNIDTLKAKKARTEDSLSIVNATLTTKKNKLDEILHAKFNLYEKKMQYFIEENRCCSKNLFLEMEKLIANEDAKEYRQNLKLRIQKLREECE